MIPAFCSIDVIDECVLRCKMCYKWKDPAVCEALPDLEDWKRFFDSLDAMSGSRKPEIVFAGGETFLYKPLFDVLRYASQRGFSTAMASSGFLINMEMAKKLADSGLKNITISLDSLDQNIHDFLRGRKGVYHNALKAIEYLSSHKINICISTIVMDINLNEILEITDWALKNDKIQDVIFLMPMQPNSAAPDPLWYKDKELGFLWPKDIDKAVGILEGIKQLKISGDLGGVKSKICNSTGQLKAFQSYFRSPEMFVKKDECPMTSALHISSVGDIFFCYAQPSIGNIKKDQIQDVWDSSLANDTRHRIKQCTKNCHFLLNCYFE